MKIYRGHHIEKISHSGMYYCFIVGHGHLKADTLEGIKQLFVSMAGKIDGIIFGVSCDGGKTAVAWRRNVFEALEYLELQNRGGVTKYSVVAVKLENKGILE